MSLTLLFRELGKSIWNELDSGVENLKNDWKAASDPRRFTELHSVRLGMSSSDIEREQSLLEIYQDPDSNEWDQRRAARELYYHRQEMRREAIAPVLAELESENLPQTETKASSLSIPGLGSK